MKYKIIFLLLITVFLVGCNKENNIEDKLIGLWQYNDVYIKFNGDGTVYYSNFIDGEKKNLTILSDSGLMIHDTVFTFKLKKDNLTLDDITFKKIDNSKDFDNYLKVSSSYKNYVEEINYNNLKERLDTIGYLNYINEYYKITNIPYKETNFDSDKETIDLVCQVVNVFENKMQMNEKNCIISE